MTLSFYKMKKFKVFMTYITKTSEIVFFKQKQIKFNQTRLFCYLSLSFRVAHNCSAAFEA
jgi:hypothetical protein